ncbi:MAG: methyltransferase [Fimbriimonadaceae bacterium]
MTTTFQRAVGFVMGLAMVWALAALALLPLPSSRTRMEPLVPTDLQGRYFAPDVEGFRWVTGRRYPVYRYSGEFRSAIGAVEVVPGESPGERATLRPIAESFIFPVGRHGQVVSREGDSVLVRFGPDGIFAPSDRLILFDGLRRVGMVAVPADTGTAFVAGIFRTQLLDVDPEVAAANPALKGLGVSEYTVRTAVAVVALPPWAGAAQTVVFIVLGAVELWLFRRFRRGLLALTVGGTTNWIKSRPKPTQRTLFALAVVVLGAPIAYLVGSFLDAALRYGPVVGEYAMHWRAEVRWGFAGLAALVYYGFLIFKRRNPILSFWRAVGYRKPDWIERVAPKPAAQKWLIWSLHLLIAWAFAFALIGFIAANLNQVLAILARGNPDLRFASMNLAQPGTILEYLSNLQHNLGVVGRAGPVQLSAEHGFVIARLVVWSLTIVGCLVGYVHSVVVVGPWTKIRSVDFTPMGWFANAICYGPLLGYAFWLSLPPRPDAAPAVADGPLLTLILAVELVFNVLYTASVWNMGTKFGVMVDKGLVDRGFFGVVRHPNYTLESFMFFMLALRGLGSAAAFVAAVLHFVLYWLRSERDEQFMAVSNPEYESYRRRVTSKFIPGAW